MAGKRTILYLLKISVLETDFKPDGTALDNSDCVEPIASHGTSAIKVSCGRGRAACRGKDFKLDWFSVQRPE